MKKAHIAVAPGRDFGHNQTDHFIRLSTANSMENLVQAVQRMKALFNA